VAGVGPVSGGRTAGAAADRGGRWPEPADVPAHERIRGGDGRRRGGGTLPPALGDRGALSRAQADAGAAEDAQRRAGERAGGVGLDDGRLLDAVLVAVGTARGA